MSRLVLDPLGMTRSFFFADEVITDTVAVGHKVGEHGPEVVRDWALPRAAHPPGGIISTVLDQLQYARFQLGDGTAEDGTRLLGSDSLLLGKRSEHMAVEAHSARQIRQANVLIGGMGTAALVHGVPRCREARSAHVADAAPPERAA